MPRIQSMSPLLAKEGLNDVIQLFSDKEFKLWEQYTKSKPTKDYFYRTLGEGDMSPAAEMNEATGVTYEDFDTPYAKDWYPLKRGIGFAVSTEAIESDKYGVIARRAKKMLKSMSKSIEADAAAFMNLATSSTFAGPDGVALASASHPLDSGTDSNIVTSNPVLSYSALETAMTQLIGNKSHKGDPLMFMGPYILMVPKELNFLAQRLVETDKYPGTMNNDKNVVRSSISNVVMSPYFTSSTAWALRSASEDEHGLLIVNRRATIADQEYDFDKDVMKFKLTRIWVKAIEDWRGFMYSSGAGS